MWPVAALKGVHEGVTAAILGGGPSLPGDVARLPDNAMLISVNQHGALYRECLYIVHKDPSLAGVCALFPGLRVSIPESAPDYFWTDADGVVDGGTSSSVAVWFALHMGCTRVILCGMDCYAGGAYWHTPKAASTGFVLPPEKHVNGWRESFPVDGTIRAMSGPLIEVFGAYDPQDSPRRG